MNTFLRQHYSVMPQPLVGQIFHTPALNNCWCLKKAGKGFLAGTKVFYKVGLSVFLDGSLESVSVLATKEMLFLLDEDHQWSKSQPEGQMSSGKVTVQETQPISCLSSVHLFSSNPCQVDLKLYDEVCVCIFTCSHLNHRELKSNSLKYETIKQYDYYMDRINGGFCCLFYFFHRWPRKKRHGLYMLKMKSWYKTW